jgi:hypothetical protein
VVSASPQFDSSDISDALPVGGHLESYGRKPVPMAPALITYLAGSLLRLDVAA